MKLEMTEIEKEQVTSREKMDRDLLGQVEEMDLEEVHMAMDQNMVSGRYHPRLEGGNFR